MIQLDINALRARFFTQFAESDPQVTWVGKQGTAPDKTKTYCRLFITPGAGGYIEQGPGKSHQQDGVMTLHVYVPSNLRLSEGYAIIEKFAALFRDWRSADNLLVIENSRQQGPDEVENYNHLALRFDWSSTRQP